MGVVLAFFRAIILIISIAIWPIGYTIGSLYKKDKKKLGFYLRRHWLRYIGYPVLGIKINEIIGSSSAKPCLYVANHRAISDPFVISKFLDAFVLAKAEVGNYPIVNKAFKLSGVLYVKREEKGSRKLVREKMVETIKSGANVLVFPEGTVGVNKKTLDFKVGAFYSAAENNIPVVPIAIEYKSENSLWKHSNLFKQFIFEYSKFNKHVKLRIGDPYSSTQGENIKNHCKEWIDSQLEEMQNNWSDVNYIN